jgi:hypothetical protein
MKVRVIRAFGNYRKGDILTPAGVYRDQLIAQRLVEKVEETTPIPMDPPAVLQVSERAEPETAVRRTKRRGGL